MRLKAAGKQERKEKMLEFRYDTQLLIDGKRVEGIV